MNGSVPTVSIQIDVFGNGYMCRVTKRTKVEQEEPNPFTEGPTSIQTMIGRLMSGGFPGTGGPTWKEEQDTRVYRAQDLEDLLHEIRHHIQLKDVVPDGM